MHSPRRSLIRKLFRFFLGPLVLLLVLPGFVWGPSFYPRVFECLRVPLDGVRPAGTVFDRTGKPVASLDADGTLRPLWQGLAEVPSTLLKLLVACEDRRFYTRSGPFDARGMARALVTRRGGGSTFYQELARNLVVLPGGSFRKGFDRKIFEAIIAWRLWRHCSREEVLEAYVNRVNWGGHCGVGDASRAVFGRTPARLNGAEMAYMVSLLPRPGRVKDRAQARRYATGPWGVARSLDHPFSAPHGSDPARQPLRFVEDGRAPAPALSSALCGLVTQEWHALRDAQSLPQRGVKLKLTIDARLQRRAQQSLSAEVAGLARRLPSGTGGQLEGATLAIDHASGAILFEVPAAGPDGGAVSRERRPLGSVFKVMDLAASLEAGRVDPDTVVEDSPIAPGEIAGAEPNWPRNADGAYLGKIPLREAFVRSRNPPFCRLGESSRKELNALLARMGVPPLAPMDPGQFLGTLEWSLPDLAQRFASFANRGLLPPAPHLIAEVDTDGAGRVLFQCVPRAERVLDLAVAEQVYDLLTEVVNDPRGTAHALAGLKNLAGQFGAKTGTTNLGRDLRVCVSDRRCTLVLWLGRKDDGPLWAHATSHDSLALARSLFSDLEESHARQQR